MTEETGTFVVTHADEESAILQDSTSGRVYALASNPGVAPMAVVEATIEPVPPMESVYQVVDVHEEWTVSIGESMEPPTKQAIDAAAQQSVGDLTRIERAGTGELHVISVPDGSTEQAVADVLADEEGLVSRAARLGVETVVVRSTTGVVSVRYQP